MQTPLIRLIHAHARPALRRQRLASALALAYDIPTCDVCSGQDEKWREKVEAMVGTHLRPSAGQTSSRKARASGLKSLWGTQLQACEVDARYGGRGSSFSQGLTVLEEVAKLSPGLDTFAMSFVSSLIQRHGDEGQRSYYLPRLLADQIGTFIASSHNAEYNNCVSALEEGDFFILNGRQSEVINAEHSGIFLVMANRKAANVSEIYHERKPIHCFIVERNNPGLEVEKSDETQSYQMNNVSLNDVVVPKSSVLGLHLGGSREATEIQSEKRCRLAAVALGRSRGCLNLALQRTSLADGYDIIGMLKEVGHLRAEVQAARLMLYSAAKRRDNGLDHNTESSLASILATRVTKSTIEKCQEWLPHSEVNFLSRSHTLMRQFEDN